MIISIDTSKDSKEELRKLINFLQNYVGDSSYSTPNSEDVPMPSASAFNMFGDDSATTTPSVSSEEGKEEPEEKSGLQILPY